MVRMVVYANTQTQKSATHDHRATAKQKTFLYFGTALSNAFFKVAVLKRSCRNNNKKNVVKKMATVLYGDMAKPNKQYGNKPMCIIRFSAQEMRTMLMRIGSTATQKRDAESAIYKYIVGEERQHHDSAKADTTLNIAIDAQKLEVVKKLLRENQSIESITSLMKSAFFDDAHIKAYLDAAQKPANEIINPFL